MRFGINIDGGSGFGELLAKIRLARDAGFDSAWLPQSPGGGPRNRSSGVLRASLYRPSIISM